MTSEQLDEIEKRWDGYLEKGEVERRFLFDRWWDKRDFWDMTKALREAWAEMDELCLAVGYGERPEGQSGVHRLHGEQLADRWKHIEKERDAARAEVERLTHNLVQTERHAQLVEKSLAARQAEVVQLREILKTAGDRLRACAYELTEFSYEEMAAVLYDLPTSVEEEP